MKKVAIIGTVGVPAKYGGFESLVENMIGDNCSCDIQYTVYCSGKSYNDKIEEYKGAKLKYVPLKANGVQSIPYDIISIFRAIRENDVLLILGVSGCLILPVIRLFSRKKIIINIDGLEHRRDKWSPNVRKFLKWSEKVAVGHADVIVTDNKGIYDYVKVEYGKESEVIAYGGDHVIVSSNIEVQDYSFALCRIEPENNVHTILEAFAGTPHKLKFVGNWLNSEYGEKLVDKYKNSENIELLNPIYDLERLGELRGGCKYYIHGHSAGGTNPSLVEAMFFGRPIVAFDVIYNRETTENKACYFTDSQNLRQLVSSYDISCGDLLVEVAKRRYCWSIIAKQYESLY